MGCWNQTCGLTQLHIKYNTDVVVFAMTKNTTTDSLCYTTPFYAPVMMPFYAKYNDYGGAENCHGLGFNLVMDAIKEQLVELPLGENKYHDVAVKKEGFGEEQFFDAVHEGRLFVQGGFKRQRVHVGFMMIRKDIFDHILENRRMEKYVGNNLGTISHWGDTKDYIEYTFADVVAAIPECTAALLATANDDLSPLYRFDPLRALRKLRPDGTLPNLAAGLLAHEDYRYSAMVRPSAEVDRYITTNDAAGLTEFLTEYLKALWIDGFMLDTRKFWSPQAGAGSQQAEPEGYLLMIDAMKAALDSEKREYEEDYED